MAGHTDRQWCETCANTSSANDPILFPSLADQSANSLVANVCVCKGGPSISWCCTCSLCSGWRVRTPWSAKTVKSPDISIKKGRTCPRITSSSLRAVPWGVCWEGGCRYPQLSLWINYWQCWEVKSCSWHCSEALRSSQNRWGWKKWRGKSHRSRINF